MFKSYVITEDKNPTSPRFNIRSKKTKNSIIETIDTPVKTKLVVNRYSSVKHKENHLTKSENLPSIANIKNPKRGTSIKSIISTSFRTIKLPDISKRYSSKEAIITDSNKDVVNDIRNFTLFCKLYEIWLDIELKFENKNECINLIKFYLQFLKEEVLSISIESDEYNFFHDSKWNLLFVRIAKIQSIVASVLLIVLANFPEQNLGQLRKVVTNCSHTLIIFLDNYILDNFEMKPTFITKIIQFKENMKPFGRNNIISLLSRNLDYSLTVMKNYINVFEDNFKIFHTMLSDCMKHIDMGIPYYTISNLIINSIVYSILYKDNYRRIIRDSRCQTYDPFLPPMDKKYQYTLVLDLDETLVHYVSTPNSFVLFLRPYLFEFLDQLKEIFEIVIFTAATKLYADTVLNFLDPNGTYFQHRLYRDHTSIVGYSVVKDLNLLGRNLSKTVIIDNIEENFCLSKSNGIVCNTWKDNINDKDLLYLSEILKNLYRYNTKDVRKSICKIKEILSKRGTFIDYSNINVNNYI